MKQLIKIVYFIVLLGVLMPSCSIKRRVKQADKRYELGEYYLASQKYRRVSSKIPRKHKKMKARVNFQLADCYQKMGYFPRATRSYKTAIRYGYSDSIVYLNIAKMQLATGKYKDAAENFAEYLKFHPNSKEALSGLMSTQDIKHWKAIKTRYKVYPAKEFASRRNSDYSLAFLDEEGTSVIFTSNRKVENNVKKSSITGVAAGNLFTCRQNNSQEWEEVQYVDGEVNTENDEGAPTVSSDGKTLIFTRCRLDFEAAELYESKRSGAKWSKPSKIKLFNDSSISCGHPALSPDGETLYFVSNAPGGYGNNDIWMATKTKNGWTVPVNLGADINTEGNESFPCVRANNELYFSSDGKAGFGGLDIYKARGDSSNNWVVENMLQPINSAADDFGMCFKGQTNEGYFSSNRKQRRATDRLFRFELPELVYDISGKVKDEQGEVLAGATIRLIGNKGENIKIPTRKDGSYSVKLEKGSEYVMMASARGCLNGSYQFDTYGLLDSKSYTKDFELATIAKPVKLNNIFFESGKWTLTEDSSEALDELVQKLRDNPNIAMEISAYTDRVGNYTFNQTLSEKRARSVVDYIIKAGIDPKRLTSVGHGEEVPVVVDKELAKKYNFLTEGTELSETFILDLTKEQQDICDQINRRTQFKVTKTTYNLY